MDAENLLFIIVLYLIGMAFAGSFIGRRWMGSVDIFLHKLLKRKITLNQYLYWKYFTGINDPPKPTEIKKRKGVSKILLDLLIGED